MAKLVLMRGPPSSGKSTLAVDVAKRMKGKTVVIPKDAIVFGFHFIKIKQDKFKSQAIINASLNYYLKNNINVIVDGVFGGKEPMKKINQMKALAKKNKSKFYLINLDVDFETAYQRDEKRKQRISKKEVKKWYDHFYLKQVKEGFVLDNRKISKKKAVDAILKYIR